jgi:hypothetical protein
MKRLFRRAFLFAKRFYRLSGAHNLNPKVFLVLSALGIVVQILYYLPWLKEFNLDLAFLAFLRVLALIGPLYIALRGKRIAALVNASLLVSWILGTTWHVCYFVYLL